MIKRILIIFSFLILTAIYIYSSGDLTVIQANISDKAFSSLKHGELLKGEKIQGSFVAEDNYLGQVSIRFYNFQRINPDSVVFRIKEQSSNRWYYEDTYKTDQFQPNLLFPFGFSPISDSKGKKYYFQVESLNGLPEHSIGVSSIEPLGKIVYQYPKGLLVKNPRLALSFFISKLNRQEINTDAIISFLIYLNFIFLILILEYMFIDELSRSKFKIRFNSSLVIVLGLLTMFLSTIILYLKKPAFSMSITILAYFLLVLGAILLLVETKTRKTHNNKNEKKY